MSCTSKTKLQKGFKRLVTLLVVLSIVLSTMFVAFADVDVDIGDEDYISAEYPALSDEVHEADEQGYLPIVPLSPIFVTFDPNGGAHQSGFGAPVMVDDLTNTVGVFMPPNPSYSVGAISLTFRHWNMNQDGSGAIFTVGTPVLVDTTVYAQWAAQVTFHLNGGELPGGIQDAPGPFLLAPGNSIDTEPGISWPADPTRLGFIFNGWYDAPAGGNEIFSNTPIDSNIELTARWIPLDIWTVTFNPDGGTPDINNPPSLTPMTRQAFDTYSIAESWPTLNSGATPDFGRSAPLAAYPGGTRTLHSWWTLQGGMYVGGNSFFALPRTGLIAQNHAILPVTQNMTVYPNWVVRVIFDANGGSIAAVDSFRDISPAVIDGPPGFGTVAANGVAGVNANWDGVWPAVSGMPNAPTRAGHTFLGWVYGPPSFSPPTPPTVPPGLTLPPDVSPVPPTGFDWFLGTTQVTDSMTVWALWQENPLVTITFDINDVNDDGIWDPA
ncbi:MAG: InlB B-repeat-containing protein, partial [Oscillospiraceae bacterium]|nr:InlB B-repeat-containing protein [Oscillospiraceae bacterium]